MSRRGRGGMREEEIERYARRDAANAVSNRYNEKITTLEAENERLRGEVEQFKKVRDMSDNHVITWLQSVVVQLKKELAQARADGRDAGHRDAVKITEQLIGERCANDLRHEIDRRRRAA